MSARIIEFPDGVTQLLELEGYTLIAWRQGCESVIGCGEQDWLYGLWKPTDGKGFYRSGYRVSEMESRLAPGGRWPAEIDDSRVSRAAARRIWMQQLREPHHWRHLVSEAEAFPEKRRRYLAPPRIARRLPSMAGV